MDRFTKDFFKAAMIRAARTGAQVLLSMITVGMSITDLDWISALSVTAMSMLVSLLTAVATGLPESKIDGVATFDEIYTEPGTEPIKDGAILRLKVTPHSKEAE